MLFKQSVSHSSYTTSVKYRLQLTFVRGFIVLKRKNLNTIIKFCLSDNRNFTFIKVLYSLDTKVNYYFYYSNFQRRQLVCETSSLNMGSRLLSRMVFRRILQLYLSCSSDRCYNVKLKCLMYIYKRRRT